MAHVYPCPLPSIDFTVLLCSDAGQTVGTVMWPTCISVHCPVLWSLCHSVLSWSNCSDSDVAYMYPCSLSNVAVTVLLCSDAGQAVGTNCIPVHCPVLLSLRWSVLMLVRL